MQISVETDVRLSDKQVIEFKNLFKFLLRRSVTEKGNVQIPFDGKGNVGQLQFTGFHDIRVTPNGNGNSDSVLQETNRKS